MDPRSPLSPVGGPRGVKRRVPSPEENIQQVHTVNPSQTSLPSISQLVNAFGSAPQPAMSSMQHGLASSPESGYYAHNTQVTASSYMHERDMGHFGYGIRGGSGAGSIGGGGGDSEHDEIGIIDGPPKKKRRRQALSCTGTRQGISTGLPGLPTSSNLSQVNPGGPQPGNYYPGTDSNDVSGQHSQQPSSPFGNAGGYNAMMPPPPMQMSHFELATSSQAGTRYIKSETGGATSPVRAVASLPSPRNAPRPTSSSSNAKLSLAPITSTSPYHRPIVGEGTAPFPQHDHQSMAQTHMSSPTFQAFASVSPQQSKNCHAQTLNFLGVRLRSVCRQLGPAITLMLTLIPILIFFLILPYPHQRPLSFTRHALPLILHLIMPLLNTSPARPSPLRTATPQVRVLPVLLNPNNRKILPRSPTLRPLPLVRCLTR
ncbi:hypothetical protein D9619_013366 [Psilocybe cf. subviscida]|uniref:Uncharacterized protein n=1 Tax=Psilocybe cf. subviscida TaxID=2480587 RepID=A0A8H5F982_9AGAR|nr:hypothetical protein D9619_013366 [Psilocybe cf. subviscida]